jgi:DNA-binding transcriptional MocR family regulator
MDSFAERSRLITASEIRELLKLVNRPGLISFAGGIPASELFPYDEVEAAYQRVFSQSKETAARALQYSVSEGYPPLRELIKEKMEKLGIKLSLDNIMVTSGSQQALEFMGKLFVDRGQPVVVENPTYLGALQAFIPTQPSYLTVPIDDEGLQIDELAKVINQHPKFIYTISNYQNPGGVTLSHARRLRLIELAHRYDVPVIEDDAYGALYYEGEPETPIIALDAAQRGGDIDQTNIIYLSSASKILAPGFRVAWAVGPKAAIERMVMLKQGADLHSSTANQMLVHELMTQPAFVDHLAKLRQHYGERRTAMLNAIEKHFPPGVAYTRPNGGMFIWATLPPVFNTKQLLQQALDEINVAFVPGAAFFADRSGTNTLRLNFSMMPPERITEGIELLGGMLTRELEKAGVAAQ